MDSAANGAPEKVVEGRFVVTAAVAPAGDTARLRFFFRELRSGRSLAGPLSFRVRVLDARSGTVVHQSATVAAVSGRGDRRMEFRSIPLNASIRIYTVRGQLVQTLRQDGSNNGFVAWDLRTKDNLDVAPGLYVYRVDAAGLGDYIGKFAIIK